jgi:hypothetical protein
MIIEPSKQKPTREINLGDFFETDITLTDGTPQVRITKDGKLARKELIEAIRKNILLDDLIDKNK